MSLLECPEHIACGLSSVHAAGFPITIRIYSLGCIGAHVIAWGAERQVGRRLLELRPKESRSRGSQRALKTAEVRVRVIPVRGRACFPFFRFGTASLP